MTHDQHDKERRPAASRLRCILLFLFLAGGAVEGFGQYLDVSPNVVTQGECIWLSAGSPYDTIALQYWLNGSGPYEWYDIPLDGNGQYYTCTESWLTGFYEFTAILYYSSPAWFSIYSTLTINSPPLQEVMGVIDSVPQEGNQFFLCGWACARFHPNPIDVHVYVGGPSWGGGTMVAAATANQPSEPEVAAACETTGSNFRFRIQIPPTVIQQFAGQPIYIHGISPFGLGNNLLDNSGVFNVPSLDQSITGNIEQVAQQGNQFFIQGWACAKTHPNPIDIRIYFGGPAGTGAYWQSVTANAPSDSGVAAACNSTGSNYRFWVEIPDSTRQQFGGQTIFIHGVSPFGLADLLIGNSGVHTVPAIDLPVFWKKDHIRTPGGAVIVTAVPQ